MKCPDTDRLIDLVVGGRPHIELEAHLKACPSCEADVKVLLEVLAALRPEIDVPEKLVQRVLADLALFAPPLESRQISVTQVAASVVLGMLTTVGALVASGSVGAGNPAGVLMFSVVVGSATGVLQIRAGRKPDLNHL
jgi:hypothetical protein